jgi:hypothetical protein
MEGTTHLLLKEKNIKAKKEAELGYESSWTKSIRKEGRRRGR